MKVKLKNPDHTINFGGQVIGAHNITPELYNSLVEKAPSIADQFIVEDDVEEKKVFRPKGQEEEKK